MNRSHFSGSCSGKFRILPPFALVGLQGTTEIADQVFALRQLLLLQPQHYAHAFQGTGKAQCEAHTIEQRQDSGAR